MNEMWCMGTNDMT